MVHDTSNCPLTTWSHGDSGLHDDLDLDGLLSLINLWEPSGSGGSIRAYIDDLHVFLKARGLEVRRFWIPSLLVGAGYPVDVIHVGRSGGVEGALLRVRSILDLYDDMICLAMGEPDELRELLSLTRDDLRRGKSVHLVEVRCASGCLDRDGFDSVANAIFEWRPALGGKDVNQLADELGGFLNSRGYSVKMGWMPRFLVEDAISVDIIRYSGPKDVDFLLERTLCNLDLHNSSIMVICGLDDPGVSQQIEDVIQGLFWDEKNIAIVLV